MSDLLAGAPAPAAPAPTQSTSQSSNSAPATETPAAAPSETTDTTQGGGQKDGVIPETSTPTASETTAEGTTETPASTTETTAATLDPEIEAFARGKGIDPAEVTKSPVLMKALASHKEAEAEMNRLRAQLDKQKETGIAATPESLESAAKTEQPEISPVQKVKQLFKAALDNRCAEYGVSNEAELRSKFPDAYNELHGWYLADLTVANSEMHEWSEGQAARKRAAEEKERQAIGFVQSIKTKSAENLNGYRTAIKDFDANLVRSGANQVITLIADAMGITPDYLHADKRVMDFFAKASESIMSLESGSLKKKLYAEWEAARNKQQAAEIPSGSSDGRIDSFAAKAHNVGASIL